jgi:small-conductance mechanosensitive channel
VNARLKEIFDFKLIELSKYSITAGDVITVVGAFLILFAFLRLFKFLLSRLKKQGRIDAGRSNSVYQIVKYLLLVIVVAGSLETIGVKLSFLLAGSAALLVGLGLGLQQTFNDMVSGIILLVESNLQVGDVIEVEGVVGRVQAIKLRTSEIATRDGINIIVPNHKFVTDNVINWSHNKKPRRFKVGVGVSYNANAENVRKVLLECVNQLPGAVLDMSIYKPVIRLSEFADSSVIFEVLFWSYDYFRFESMRSDLRFIIAQKFAENSIQIPYPQRDLHIVSDATKKNTDKEDKEGDE